MRLAAPISALVLAFAVPAAANYQSLAPFAYLKDVSTGAVLYSQAADQHMPPASMAKMMTTHVAFDLIKQGKLRLDQKFRVRAETWQKWHGPKAGSTMFLSVDQEVSVEDLLHGIVTLSGNDACVVLAEAIAGSEETFAQLMNREAERLGMKSSRFTNSTGLTDANHYTTTRDLSILASALIRDFPEFYPIYSEKEYRFNNITQANRNRLLYTDPTVDGVKTGHTEAAGWCLIASAKRDSRRLLSVVVGTASDSVRAQESQKLLNYGYQFYDFVKVLGKDQPATELRLWKAARNTVKVGMTRDFGISVPKGSGGKVTTNVVPAAKHQIGAVAAGQPLATLQVLVDGKVDSEHPLIALEAVEEAGWFGKLWDSLLLLFQ